MKAFPVYPFEYYDPDEGLMQHTGMDLRDYFAAKALQGFLANPETAPNEVNVIKACWGIADAMMKAREQ